MVVPSFDPLAMIRVLNAHEVRYVVIGGIAAGVQGVVWATADLDICYRRSRGDLPKLSAALAELEARPINLPAGVTVQLDARALQHGDWWMLFTRFGRLDCLGEPAPGIDYDYLAPRSRLIEGSERYTVASFADLIAMKQAAGRPRDVGHIELLRAADSESRQQRGEEHRR
jgi:hypothetical protein